VFGPLKEAFKVWTFISDVSVQEAVEQWFRQQLRDFFAGGTYQLVHQWDSCLNACGDLFSSVALPLLMSIFQIGFHLNMPYNITVAILIQNFISCSVPYIVEFVGDHHCGFQCN
jgi:hypothetical protein